MYGEDGCSDHPGGPPELQAESHICGYAADVARDDVMAADTPRLSRATSRLWRQERPPPYGRAVESSARFLRGRSGVLRFLARGTPKSDVNDVIRWAGSLGGSNPLLSTTGGDAGTRGEFGNRRFESGPVHQMPKNKTPMKIRSCITRQTLLPLFMSCYAALAAPH